MNSSIRVLIVDNDESMINEVKKYFSSHEVIEVVACKKDGEEGLEYILNNPNKYDLIINTFRYKRKMRLWQSK